MSETIIHWSVQWGLRLAIAAPILAVLGIGAFRLGVMDYRLPLLGLVFGCLLAVVALALVVVAAVMGNISGRLLLALVIAVAFLIVPLNTLRRGVSVPPIHDISTDLDNPPQFEAVPRQRAPVDNSLAIEQKTLDAQKAYYDVRPYILDIKPADAFDRALGAAQGMGWQIVAADRSRGHIEATATTPLFGFKDDIVIRVQAIEGGTRIDVRSASRVGVSDLGANAARIKDFMNALDY